MLNIIVSDELHKCCPDFVGAALFATVSNTNYNESLWNEIYKYCDEYKASHTIGDIKINPVISATRQAYKACGKDPNRYRPSAEALCRRILKDIPLYKIDTLVDIVNLVSMRTGYSIGGFDTDKIKGNTLILGIGKANEPYAGIGRGELNIEGLPVYRDAIGGIGTPTSDNERTKINIDTKHFLAIFNSYSGYQGLIQSVENMKKLLEKYAEATDITHNIFRCKKPSE